MPLRWVHVRDLEGTHRDEYFYATDPAMGPAAVVTHYAGRWNIESTFQEARAHLGPETTRGWCRRTVERAAPCLFGLYSVVALLFHALPEAARSGAVRRPGRAAVTFSDAVATVRLWLWAEWVFPQAGAGWTRRNSPRHCERSCGRPSRPRRDPHRSASVEVRIRIVITQSVFFRSVAPGAHAAMMPP